MTVATNKMQTTLDNHDRNMTPSNHLARHESVQAIAMIINIT